MIRSLTNSFVAAALVLASGAAASAELRIGDLCRVKGQEENTLHGLGLVVGLKGTGDGAAKPTIQALARTMQLMGMPVGQGPNSTLSLDDLKDANNVALVFVTATVPAAGARQGEKLDCTVNAISAKSLDGGFLMMTPLLGPQPGNPRVYAFAQGAVHLEDTARPTTGKIHLGCRLEESFHNVFVKDGKITLILNENHAHFETAQDISDIINNYPDFRGAPGQHYEISKPLDQVNIEVTIPEKYLDAPVLFVAQVLNQRVLNPENTARVVINQREGVVVIGSNVEIGPVAVAHKNLTIEAGGTAGGQFVPLDPAADRSTTKLKALVDALNALKVPTTDIIEVIKSLEKSGDLYGRVIVQ